MRAAKLGLKNAGENAMPDGQAPLSAFGGKADMKNVGMVLDKFLILIGMVRFAPDQCLGPRAWLSMFVQLPAPGRRRRTARFRTVTNRGRKIDVRVQQAA